MEALRSQVIAQSAIVIEPHLVLRRGQGNLQIGRVVGKVAGVSRPGVNVVRGTVHERRRQHARLPRSRDNRHGRLIVERRQIFLGGAVYVGLFVTQDGIALAPRRNLAVATPTVHKWSTLFSDIG